MFGAIYLLSHGAAKIVLVTLVLRDKLWAYPWLIVLLLAFIAYQLYRITAVHFSVGLTALTVFDAVPGLAHLARISGQTSAAAPGRDPRGLLAAGRPRDRRATARPWALTLDRVGPLIVAVVLPLAVAEPFAYASLGGG